MLFLSFMNLFRNYRRTMAILLTIAIGTGVLFSFKGFIHGVLSQYRDNTIHAHYGHGQINMKNYRDSSHAEPWKQWMSNTTELQDYLAAHESIEHIFPRINFPALIKKGNISVSGSGQGINAEKEADFFYGLNIDSGITLTSQSEGLLLGIGLARALDVQPGDKVTLLVNAINGSLSKSEFVVTGIFQTGSLDFDGRIFRIQLDKAQKLLKTNSIELVSLGLKEKASWDLFAKELEERFPTLEATSFAVLDKVYYQNSVDWLNAQFNVIQCIILSIVLLGIFNSISASILERKQEIGNFRANGESIANVMQLITLEGTFLGIVGSCLGITLAFFVLSYLNNEIQMPPGPGLTRPFYISFKFEWAMVYSTVALTTIAAIVASILAGIRVARMPIAKALRSY
jgi:putative ABC transport system permease protein